MNLISLTAVLGVAFLLIEVLFLLYCFRWLSSGKRQRQKEFARLDAERAELVELQGALASEMKEARRLSAETLARLGRLGAETNAEWHDMVDKMSMVLSEVETRTQALAEENLETMQRTRLSLEKMLQDAQKTSQGLHERTEKARALLRFFDAQVSTEEIVKELQTEKYDVAKKTLADGIDGAAIRKKLGLTQGEVSLLSYVK